MKVCGIGIQPLLPKFKNWLIVDRSYKPETAQKQIYNLQMAFRFIKILDQESFRNYLVFEKKTKKPSTIEKYLLSMRMFLDYLIKLGIIKDNWAREIPLPKKDKTLPVVLSTLEIEKLLATNVPRSYIHYKNPAKAKDLFDTILSLLAKTGSRLGEVLSIKVGDINWEEESWRLSVTKTRRGRIIPIPPDLIPKMKRLAGDRNPDSPLFYHELTRKPVRIHNVETNFKLRLRDSGIRKKATPHTLRHSFITELLRNDISVLKIANIVGHENIQTTQDYAKLLYEDLRDAILRHPLTAKNRNPYDILKHIKEVILKLHIKEDPRFMFNIEEGNEGIRISIFIR